MQTVFYYQSNLFFVSDINNINCITYSINKLEEQCICTIPSELPLLPIHSYFYIPDLICYINSLFIVCINYVVASSLYWL